MSARSTRITGSKRDDYMRRYLVGLIAQGLTKPEIRRLATLYSDTLFKPAFDTTEIRATVAALWKRFQEEGLFDTMDNVTPRDVAFLWEPYLVQGAVNLLEGDPGVGKTYLLCALAAAISSGGYLPGRPVGKPANVLFMSAEDDPETTLVRRLAKMNADLARISFATRYFRLEEEALGWIESHVTKLDVKLLILDPLLAYMQGGIDMNKANETRPFLSRLRELAQATGCTIVGLRHLTKADKEKAIFRGLGSVDIAAAVRSIVQVGYHPDDKNIRVMCHEKHNLSWRGPSQMYALEGGNGRSDVPQLSWKGECDLTASDLGRPVAKPGRPATASTNAEAFVKGFLRDGPKEKRELDDAALELGIKETTLRRVLEKLTAKNGKMVELRDDHEDHED